MEIPCTHWWTQLVDMMHDFLPTVYQQGVGVEGVGGCGRGEGGKPYVWNTKYFLPLPLPS